MYYILNIGISYRNFSLNVRKVFVIHRRQCSIQSSSSYVTKIISDIILSGSLSSIIHEPDYSCNIVYDIEAIVAYYYGSCGVKCQVGISPSGLSIEFGKISDSTRCHTHTPAKVSSYSPNVGYEGYFICSSSLIICSSFVIGGLMSFIHVMLFICLSIQPLVFNTYSLFRYF